VRKWKVLGGATPEALAQNSKVIWDNAYSFVSGILPLEYLPLKNETALAQFHFETIVPGKIRLKLNSIAGLKMWVDSVPTDLKRNPVLNLSKGAHQITFSIDAKKRHEGLRVELEDVSGSPAKYQLAESR
jgi:hypothetical protein